jgi:hypothetical protein
VRPIDEHLTDFLRGLIDDGHEADAVAIFLLIDNDVVCYSMVDEDLVDDNDIPYTAGEYLKDIKKAIDDRLKSSGLDQGPEIPQPTTQRRN